jgi:hypothetical protein
MWQFDFLGKSDLSVVSRFLTGFGCPKGSAGLLAECTRRFLTDGDVTLPKT